MYFSVSSKLPSNLHFFHFSLTCRIISYSSVLDSLITRLRFARVDGVVAERVEELEESVWSVVRQENEREDQWEGVQNSGKTSIDVRGRDMGVKEGSVKEIGGRRNENATMDVQSCEAGLDQK